MLDGPLIENKKSQQKTKPCKKHPKIHLEKKTALRFWPKGWIALGAHEPFWHRMAG